MGTLYPRCKALHSHILRFTSKNWSFSDEAKMRLRTFMLAGWKIEVKGLGRGSSLHSTPTPHLYTSIPPISKNIHRADTHPLDGGIIAKWDKCLNERISKCLNGLFPGCFPNHSQILHTTANNFGQNGVESGVGLGKYGHSVKQSGETARRRHPVRRDARESP